MVALAARSAIVHRHVLKAHLGICETIVIDFVYSCRLELTQLVMLSFLSILRVLVLVSLVLVDRCDKILLGLLHICREEAGFPAIVVHLALLNERGILMLDCLQSLRVLILQEPQ